MKMWKTFAALALGLVLAACDVSGFVPTEHMDFAKRVVIMVRTQDDANLQAVTHPDLWRQLPADVRARMAAMFPPGEPASVTVSSWKSNMNNGVTNVTMVMLYKYPQRDVEVNLGFQSLGTGYVLTMIYTKPVGMTPQRQSAPQPNQPSDKSTTL